MNAQNPQYKAFYNPTTGQYVNANGLNLINVNSQSLLTLTQGQTYDRCTVTLTQSNGQTHVKQFSAPTPTSTGNNSSDAYEKFLDKLTNIYTFVITAGTTGKNAEETMTAFNGLKGKILFQSTVGQIELFIDFAKGLGSGEGFMKATVTTGLKAGELITISLATEAILASVGLAGTVGFLPVTAAVAATLVIGYGLNEVIKFGVSQFKDDKGDPYTDLSSLLFDKGSEIFNKLALTNPVLQIGGKPLTQIHTWKDQDTLQVKGTDFTTSIDPKTGNLVFQTGLEATRDQFRNITNLEALIGSAQQKNPDILIDPINLRFVNTQTGETNSLSRISAKMEQRLNELTGPTNNPLNTMTPVAKNEQASYHFKSQMANLKLKNAEFNQAKKDNLQTGLNQAKTEGTLPNLGRQQTIDDRARMFVKAAGINRPDDDPRNNEFTFFRETRQYKEGDLINGDRSKTEVDVLKIDLRTGLQRLATHLDDYDPKIANEYDKAAAENDRVKKIWLGYSQRVGNALGKAPAMPSGLAVDPNTIPTTPTTMGGRPGIGYYVPSGTGMEAGMIIWNPATRADTYVAPPEHTESVHGELYNPNKHNPLMIDLPGSPIGFETLGMTNNAIYFDILQDGKFYRTGWAGPTDGILVVDQLNDSKITNSDEFFGSTTSSGFFELMGYDTNRDGFVDASDLNFSKLKIWQDLNSNAITDSGELRTLASYNIKSLSLSHISTPMEDKGNGNIITQISRVVMNDGSNILMGDAAFGYSALDVITPALDVVLDPTTLSMPWLKGSGNVPDLIMALQSNAALRSTVTQLMTATSLPTVVGLMDTFLVQWAGVTSASSTANWVDPANTANVYVGVSQQRAELLSKFLNTSLTLQGNDADATKGWLDSAYYLISSKAMFALLAQVPVGQGLGLTYNYGTDTFSWSLGSDAEALGKLYMADNGVWRATLDHATSFFGIEMGLATPTVVRTGAAILNGTSGTDLLDGGLGVETLKGGLGSDVYIWRRGDGNDIIQDTGGTGDSIVFTSGVKADQIRLETPGDGSVFVRDTVSGQSIRFVDPGTFVNDGARLAQAIEKFVFTSNDGQMIKTSDLFVRNSLATTAANTITGTPLNDYIQGLAGNDWLQGFNGNDYLEGGTGNDNLDGYEGDDIYFFSPGDGSDTIREFNKGGNDTILFSSAVNPLKVALFRDINDLVVKYSATDKITVKDYFPTSGASDIEKIQLADGRFLSVVEVDSLVMQVAQYRTSAGAALTSVDQVQTTPALMSVIAAAF